MAGRPEAPPPEPRFTVMVVPDGGRGNVVERSFSLRHARLAATGAGVVIAGLLLAAVVQASTLSRVLGHDDLVAENLSLRSQVEADRAQLAELEPLIRRVRAYDETLRGLAARGALPGFGPLDEDAMAAREDWIRGVVGAGAAGAPSITAEQLFAELRAIDLDELDLNLARVQAASEAMPQLWPADGPVSSSFGWRRNPFGRSRWKFHGGLDIAAEYGSPILATGAGVVVWADWSHGCGRMVEIDHGQGVATRYCHASHLLVAVGDEVLAGETVALVGSSGNSTGPHCHYELDIDGEKVDPYPYLPEDEGR